MLRQLPLALLLVLAACKDPGRLDLLLRPSDDLDLASIDSLEVRLLADATGNELRRATVSGADLDGLPEVFAKSEIDPGSSYVFEIRAAVDTALCPSGRVVGRSLPVSVEGDDSVSSATAFVACADGISQTGRMRDERALHGTIWAPAQGGAVLVGGASSIAVGTQTVVPLAKVELYDVARGEFSSTPDLDEARVFPGLALDAEGRVVVMGGATEHLFTPTEWLDTVEEIDGTARRGKGLLDGRWIEPHAVALTDGTLALVGLGFHRAGEADIAYQVSFYDPGTETVPHDAIEETVALNEIFVTFPGRGRALLAGGDGGGTDPVRPALLCDDGDCGCRDAPCLLDLGDEATPESWGPGAAWNDSGGAWLSCPSGGGTAWIVGGKIRDPDDPGVEVSVGDVYCYRDSDEPAAELVHVGALRPRNGHGVVAVRGDRLLVVGGSSNAGGGLARSVPEAELVRVSPCACDPIEPADVTDVEVDASLREDGHYLASRTPVVLGDGTVLVTGAVLAVGLDLEASSEAWLFTPDLPD